MTPTLAAARGEARGARRRGGLVAALAGAVSGGIASGARFASALARCGEDARNRVLKSADVAQQRVSAACDWLIEIPNYVAAIRVRFSAGSGGSGSRIRLDPGRTKNCRTGSGLARARARSKTPKIVQKHPQNAPKRPEIRRIRRPSKSAGPDPAKTKKLDRALVMI